MHTPPPDEQRRGGLPHNYLGESPVLGDHALEDDPYELLSLGRIVLAVPQFAEVAEQRDAALAVQLAHRADFGELTGQFGLAPQVVLAAVVAQFAEVPEPFEAAADLFRRRRMLLKLGCAQVLGMRLTELVADAERRDKRRPT